MEEVFKQLEKDGENTVKSLVDWMKDANIVLDETAEQSAKELFGIAEDAKVELAKFKEVIEKTAMQQKKSVEQLNRQLSQHGLVLLGALEVSAKAFKEYLEKHKC